MPFFFNLDRSFSHLKEKFPLRVSNLHSTNHQIFLRHCGSLSMQFSAHRDNHRDISCHIVPFVHSPPPVCSGDCFHGFLYIRWFLIQNSGITLKSRSSFFFVLFFFYVTAAQQGAWDISRPHPVSFPSCWDLSSHVTKLQLANSMYAIWEY